MYINKNHKNKKVITKKKKKKKCGQRPVVLPRRPNTKM